MAGARAGDQGILVLARKAGVYEFVQQLSVVQIPLGIGRLAAGAPGDVVGMIGDFTGLGVTTEIVPLLNLQDGTEQLK